MCMHMDMLCVRHLQGIHRSPVGTHGYSLDTYGCRTFMDHRGQRRLNELDEERQRVLETQRVQLVALLSAEEAHMQERLSPCVHMYPGGNRMRS